MGHVWIRCVSALPRGCLSDLEQHLSMPLVQSVSNVLSARSVSLVSVAVVPLAANLVCQATDPPGLAI